MPFQSATARTAVPCSWFLHCPDVYALLAGREDGSRPEIYLKREDLNHTGAHKINNSLGQALLCRRLGKKRIVAETGAGQHGVATVSAWGSFGHAPGFAQCTMLLKMQNGYSMRPP